MSALESKVVVITGAKGGLGTYVTQAYLEAGAQVVGVSRSIQQSDFPSPKFAAVSAELSDGTAADALVTGVVDRFGRIDAVVHLMGGFAGGQPVAETDDETLEKMLSMNFRSTFYIMRAAIRRMGSGGRLIAIGTRAASEPAANIGAYTASKAAVISLMRSLAVENRDKGVTSNVIVPNVIDTPATRAADPSADFSRWTDPRQMASLAVWLTSEAAAQVSGAVIPVYGRSV